MAYSYYSQGHIIQFDSLACRHSIKSREHILKHTSGIATFCIMDFNPF